MHGSHGTVGFNKTEADEEGDGDDDDGEEVTQIWEVHT